MSEQWQPVEWILGDPHDRTALNIRKCFGTPIADEAMFKVVNQSGLVLTKDGKWEYEPLPSSRDDHFYRRCRFDTWEEAVEAARKKRPDALGL